MGASEWDLPEDIQGGGTYLEDPGTFHLLINELRDGTGPNGNAIDGFSFECEVLAGTVEGCAGKKVGLTIWKPKLSPSPDKIKSNEVTKRQGAAFFIATDLINPNALGKASAIDPEQANGRQFVAKLVRSQKDGQETKFLQFHYSDIYHVDDPEVATIPKAADALEIIPKAQRHNADYFAFKAKKGSAPKPVAAAAASSNDFADL